MDSFLLALLGKPSKENIPGSAIAPKNSVLKKKSSLISEPFVCRCFFRFVFGRWVLNSAFLPQEKHKAIAERGNAADHSDTTITLQEEIRGNIEGGNVNTAITPEIQVPAKMFVPLSKSEFIALHISPFTVIFQCIKGRSARMLHFISSILDLYLTVCLICFKIPFWFPPRQSQHLGKKSNIKQGKD